MKNSSESLPKNELMLSNDDCRRYHHHCDSFVLMEDKETQTSAEVNGEYPGISSNYGYHPSRCLTVICNCNMDAHIETNDGCICHKADIIRHPNLPGYSNHQLERNLSSQSLQPYDCNIHGFREWRSREEVYVSRKRKTPIDEVESSEAKKAKDEIVEIMRQESELKTDILEIPRRSTVKLETKLPVMERYKEQLKSRVNKS